MNRWPAIDSGKSLDATGWLPQNRGMTSDIKEIRLHRRDAARNMARFYCLAIDTDVFGQVLAIRRWGRIGTTGRSQATACASLQIAMALNARQATRKRQRGYSEPDACHAAKRQALNSIAENGRPLPPIGQQRPVVS